MIVTVSPLGKRKGYQLQHCRGVASIGLRGLEPPLCLLTEWAGLGYSILSAVRLPT